MQEIFAPSLPLPRELQELPTIIAEPWMSLEGGDPLLEGPAFDRKGNLFVTRPTHGEIVRIAPDGQKDTVFSRPGFMLNGTAFHKDGRLYAGCLSGELLILNTESGEYVAPKPIFEGMPLSINDLVFDDAGRLFVTDYKGVYGCAMGGVYCLSEEGEILCKTAGGLVSPNGISLSPDKRTLWVSETKENTVLSISLGPDGMTPDFITGVTCAYRSVGCAGPDSNKVDAAGNLYQCIMGQGRIVVLNRTGVPIANVLLKGRDEGFGLMSANLAFKPGTKEGFVTAGGRGGAQIFRFEGLAEGLQLFSHS
ncbi:MAG: SMP-30/gluconolactonase/LRE family protein [Oscillospiraceae bacterium]|nr:SMP-30/gluconolactonase/LRE family protein [Oscillospiraceae bacterium]